MQRITRLPVRLSSRALWGNAWLLSLIPIKSCDFAWENEVRFMLWLAWLFPAPQQQLRVIESDNWPQESLMAWWDWARFDRMCCISFKAVLWHLQPNFLTKLFLNVRITHKIFNFFSNKNGLLSSYISTSLAQVTYGPKWKYSKILEDARNMRDTQKMYSLGVEHNEIAKRTCNNNNHQQPFSKEIFFKMLNFPTIINTQSFAQWMGCDWLESCFRNILQNLAWRGVYTTESNLMKDLDINVLCAYFWKNKKHIDHWIKTNEIKTQWTEFELRFLTIPGHTFFVNFIQLQNRNNIFFQWRHIFRTHCLQININIWYSSISNATLF